ncbi:MAG: type IV secretion system DNA-binding domain-containing protein [Alphaproteobacteria bacterium]|nr:type IV secretion system DNA-binding domain-containing protein [Alphaproteobacteria bacterium]
MRIAEFWGKSDVFGAIAICVCISITFSDYITFLSSNFAAYSDFAVLIVWLYFRWAFSRPFVLPFKFPKYANLPDGHNPPPGRPGAGKSEGIMFIGNVSDSDDPDFGRELWLTNTDARTHILYLGTTGSGKTEGLKSLVTNALAWGSGFVYVDGKADTDLWSSLFSLARRFGREDDLLILNYMTANSDAGAVSNTMNPFSNGSASYLSNMVTSLMPDAGGDNAMWKERAVALLSALMPALTWKRDHQGLLLDVGVLRENIELKPIISLSRDQNLPERIIRGLQGYLNTLPGFVEAAFDDDGNERPPSPDQPMYDLQVARQQHGYLSMQFTRSLQSLADEYGYIFKVQLADIDVLDVVLNRRILVALIPALEKSGDEAANLGKIIAASLKGMMGATLGNTVEGSWEMAIGSKQTRSASSFMTVFDEVGYYTASGMAVMAAQARSLGFSLVFAAQDLPSMEKRIKQEAQSILANCNLKIFGKIEDPLETKDFLEKHSGTAFVMETSGLSAPTSTISSMFMSSPFMDNRASGSSIIRSRVAYDHARSMREGEAHMFFSEYAVQARVFYAVPEKVKALRVHKFLPVPGTTTSTVARERALSEVSARLKDPEWKISDAGTSAPSRYISALVSGEERAASAEEKGLKAGIIALASLTALPAESPPAQTETSKKPSAKAAPPAPQEKAKVAPAQTTTAAPAVDSTLLKEKAVLRSGLPPLQEGDQFAIAEMENFIEQATAGPDENAGKKKAGKEGSVSAPSGMDIETVTPASKGSAAIKGALETELPPEVTAALQQSAQKLNEGLGSAPEKSE